MSALDDLKKMVAAAEGPGSVGEDAFMHLMKYTLPIARELIQSQVALRYIRMYFGGKGWPDKRGVGTLSDAAAIRGVAALHMNGLTEAIKEEQTVDREGTSPQCKTCGRTKAPIGRSAPMAMYGSICNDDCSGYRDDPQPDHLWPGEKQSEFGYPKET